MLCYIVYYLELIMIRYYLTFSTSWARTSQTDHSSSCFRRGMATSRRRSRRTATTEAEARSHK